MKHVHLNKHFTCAKLFQLLALSSVIVLLGVAAALLLPGNPRLDSHASRVMRSDMSIVGPPSLPAATVDAIFARIGSPMQGTGKVIETASRQNNIDDAFALAVWYTETNDGLTGVGLSYHNPGGVRGSGELLVPDDAQRLRRSRHDYRLQPCAYLCGHLLFWLMGRQSHYFDGALSWRGSSTNAIAYEDSYARSQPGQATPADYQRHKTAFFNRTGTRFSRRYAAIGGWSRTGTRPPHRHYAAPCPYAGGA